MVLTIASFLCLILIEISGWGKDVVPSYYFMKVNFTYADVSSASTLQNTTTLTKALQEAKPKIADIYEVHLWNYCTSDQEDGKITQCTDRHASFVFDPVSVWHLNETSAITAHTSSSSNPLIATASEVKDKTEEAENELLGSAGKKALDAYRKLAKIMFVLYAISFWATLATIFLGIFALFSRWGSLCTWIFSFVSLCNSPFIPDSRANGFCRAPRSST